MTLKKRDILTIAEKFLAGIEVDEREGVGPGVDAAAALAEIGDDDDAEIVAEAIWNAIDNAEQLLDPALYDDLLRVVDEHLDELSVAA